VRSRFEEQSCQGFTVFPDDIFLVSYLRSGSTCVRFLLGNVTKIFCRILLRSLTKGGTSFRDLRNTRESRTSVAVHTIEKPYATR